MILETIDFSVEDEHAEAQTRPSDLALYSQNWIWRAIECLVEAPDFQPSPRWSAERLNVSVEKIVDAFDGLERLGYIKRDGATFKKIKKEYHFGPNEISRENLLEIHSRLTHQVTMKMDSRSLFSNWFFLADEEIVSKYTPLFIDLYRKMMSEGLHKGSKDVYASLISFAHLTSQDGGQQ